MKDTGDYQVHDFVHEVNRSMLSETQNEDCSDSAARSLLASFPEYRRFDTWVKGRNFLNHAVECTSWAQQLGLRSTILARLEHEASKYARFTGQYELATGLARHSLEVLQHGSLPDATDQDILQAFDKLRGLLEGKLI